MARPSSQGRFFGCAAVATAAIHRRSRCPRAPGLRFGPGRGSALRTRQGMARSLWRGAALAAVIAAVIPLGPRNARVHRFAEADKNEDGYPTKAEGEGKEDGYPTKAESEGKEDEYTGQPCSEKCNALITECVFEISDIKSLKKCTAYYEHECGRCRVSEPTAEGGKHALEQSCDAELGKALNKTDYDEIGDLLYEIWQSNTKTPACSEQCGIRLPQCLQRGLEMGEEGFDAATHCVRMLNYGRWPECTPYCKPSEQMLEKELWESVFYDERSAAFGASGMGREDGPEDVAYEDCAIEQPQCTERGRSAELKHAVSSFGRLLENLDKSVKVDVDRLRMAARRILFGGTELDAATAAVLETAFNFKIEPPDPMANTNGVPARPSIEDGATSTYLGWTNKIAMDRLIKFGQQTVKNRNGHPRRAECWCDAVYTAHTCFAPAPCGTKQIATCSSGPPEQSCYTTAELDKIDFVQSVVSMWCQPPIPSKIDCSLIGQMQDCKKHLGCHWYAESAGPKCGMQGKWDTKSWDPSQCRNIRLDEHTVALQQTLARAARYEKDDKDVPNMYQWYNPNRPRLEAMIYYVYWWSVEWNHIGWRDYIDIGVWVNYFSDNLDLLSLYDKRKLVSLVRVLSCTLGNLMAVSPKTREIAAKRTDPDTIKVRLVLQLKGQFTGTLEQPLLNERDIGTKAAFTAYRQAVTATMASAVSNAINSDSIPPYMSTDTDLLGINPPQLKWDLDSAVLTAKVDNFATLSTNETLDLQFRIDARLDTEDATALSGDAGPWWARNMTRELVPGDAWFEELVDTLGAGNLNAGYDVPIDALLRFDTNAGNAIPSGPFASNSYVLAKYAPPARVSLEQSMTRLSVALEKPQTTATKNTWSFTEGMKCSVAQTVESGRVLEFPQKKMKRGTMQPIHPPGPRPSKAGEHHSPDDYDEEQLPLCVPLAFIEDGSEGNCTNNEWYMEPWCELELQTREAGSCECPRPKWIPGGSCWLRQNQKIRPNPLMTSSTKVQEGWTRMARPLPAATVKIDPVTFSNAGYCPSKGTSVHNQNEFGLSLIAYKQACEFYELRESNDNSQAPPGPGDDTPKGESDCQSFAILHREGWVKAERAMVLSEILSLSLGDSREWPHGPVLDPPVNIEIPIPMDKQNQGNFQVPVCAFWWEEGQEWRTEGCTLVEVRENSVVCSVTHTTNFAVLMSVDGSGNSDDTGDGDDDSIGGGDEGSNSGSEENHNSDSSLNGSSSMKDKQHAVALNILLWIAIVISTVCYLTVLATYLGHRSIMTKSKVYLCHLCGNLLAGQLFFVSGLSVAEDGAGASEDTCTSFGIFAHFFLLAAFFWTFAEAVYLYRVFVRVLRTYVSGDHPLWAVGVCCYGLAAAIVAITAAVVDNAYTRHDSHCFLTHEEGAIWAFVGPVIVVICFNTMVYVRIIGVVVSAEVLVPGDLSLEDAEKYEKQIKARRAAKASVSFFFLLGIGWIFGAFAVGPAATTFGYIFTLMLILQAICILVFQCILDPSARIAWGCGTSPNFSSRSSQKFGSSDTGFGRPDSGFDEAEFPSRISTIMESGIAVGRSQSYRFSQGEIS